MSESSNSGKTAEIVGRIAESKGLGEFGTGIGMGVAMVAMFLAVPLMLLASKWDGHLHEQKQCYELKEIDKKVFKLNTCTGEMEEVKGDGAKK